MAKRKVDPTIAELTAWAASRGIDLNARTPAKPTKQQRDRKAAVIRNAKNRQSDLRRDFKKNTVKAGKGEPTRKKTVAEKKKLADEALVRQITGSGAKKGHTYDDLSADQGKGQQALRSTVNADNESAELGEPRKGFKGFLLNTLDNISRPLYGTAQAVNRNQEEFWQSRSEGEGMLESLGDGLRKGVTGFGEGATLKKKTTFSKVIQEVQDNRKALDEGKQAKDSVSGSAKVNPILKHGVGFTLDVFADPLTYTGVGLVTKAAQGGKVLKGKQVAENLVKTADVQRKITSSGAKISKEQLDTLTGVGRAPVQQIKRLDRKSKRMLDANPEAKVLYEQVRLMNKRMPRTVQRKAAAETAAFARRTSVGVAPKAVGDFSGLKDVKLREVAEKSFARELKDYPGISRLMTTAKLDEELLDAAGRSFRDGRVTVGGRWNVPEAVEAAWAKHLPQGFRSVTTNSAEEAMARVVTHEIGHQVGYLVPKAAREEIFNGIKAQAKEAGVPFEKFIADNLGQYGAKNAEEFLAEVWTEFRLANGTMRPLAKEVAAKMEQFVKTAPVAPVMQAHAAIGEAATQAAASFLKKKSDELLAAGTVTAKEAIETAGRLAKKEKMTATDLADDLLFAMQRNLSPEVSKQMRVRFGNKSVGVAGTENIGKMLAKANQFGTVNKFTSNFNKTFRAMAGVNRELGQLRNVELGKSSNRIRAHLISHERVWNVIPKADRTAILRDWQSATPNGSAIAAGVHPVEGQIDNAVEHFDDKIRDIQRTLDAESITPSQIGSWINDPKIKIENNTAPGWTTDAFGKAKVANPNGSDHKDWLIKMIKNNDKIDDPGAVLFQLHAALEGAVAKQTVMRSAAEHFGVPIPKAVDAATGHVAKRLKAQGYVEVDIPGVAGKYAFHPEIADGMKKVQAIMNDRKTVDGFLKGVDEANQIFKSVTTRYNPSFHTRTLMSEVMLSYIGGIRNPATAYKAAGQIMRGRNRQFADTPQIAGAAREAYAGDRAAIGAANALTDNAMGAIPVAGEGAKVILRRQFGGKTEALTADQIWGLYKNSGLKTGFATTDVARNIDMSRKRNVVAKVNNKLQDRFEDVEDFGRLAHFVDILKHTKTDDLMEAVKEATDTVLKYHLDYTAVTQFENTWATRVMPFYKWLRLSTPMLMESLMNNPGKAMMMPKALANMSQLAGYETDGYGIAPGGADALVPGWMQTAGALPMFNAFGDNQFFNPQQTVPIYGLLGEGNNVQGEPGEANVESIAKSAYEKVTPIARAIPELALNKTTSGAKPRDDYLRYFLNQTPQTAVGGRLSGATDSGGRSSVEQILAFLTNPGFQPLTKARMEGEAQRQWDQAKTHRAAVKKRAEAKAEEQK